MFDSIINFFKKFSKENKDSKDTAKERLHLVLMQDRANETRNNRSNKKIHRCR